MKKTYLLKLMLLAVVMFAGSGYVMADKWVKIDNHADVTASDTYLIVEVNSKTALTYANGADAAPAAIPVPLAGDVIEGEIADNLKWKFEAAEGGFVIYAANDADKEKWLYAISNNNGLRYGTGEHKVFEVDVVSEANPDYKGLRNIGQDRYIGVYIAQDWRTYTSINNNIKGSQIEFFKLDTSVPTTPTITAAGVVDFNASVGRTVEKTISVSGVNLTEGITVTGAVAPFAVSPATIDKEGGDLTISYSPTAAGTHTVTLTLSSQGAEDKTIEVTGEAFATDGDGSETAPFTVADVIILDNALGNVDKYWVKGYIVAAQAASGGGALTPLQTNFAEEAAATAILLADNPDETELENMTPVQLPAGTDARANLNLKDNPDNFKKEVVVEGILTAYFGQTPGIRSVENYKFVNTSVSKDKAISHLYARDGKVFVDATAGAQIEVYNVAGQKLAGRLAADGINTISINTQGVLIVKVGDRVGKVILK